MTSANTDVRKALAESFDEANKYDLGQCMVEFKKCMLTKDACGDNWENCVSIVASENMQNNETTSTAGTKVESVDTYDITASTMDVLNTKRIICENVLSGSFSLSKVESGGENNGKEPICSSPW